MIFRNGYRFACTTIGSWCRDPANAGNRIFSRNTAANERFSCAFQCFCVFIRGEECLLSPINGLLSVTAFNCSWLPKIIYYTVGNVQIFFDKCNSFNSLQWISSNLFTTATNLSNRIINNTIYIHITNIYTHYI